MIQTHTKLSVLALAVSSVLAGVAHAGHEIVGESKNQVIEQSGPALSGTISAGYWSKYIFRGTNLTPDSDGLIWAQGYLSVHPWENGTFTFGVWAGSQQGKSGVTGAERIGEAGGGAVGGGGSRTGTDFGIGGRTGAPPGASGAGTFDLANNTFTPLPQDQLAALAEAFLAIDKDRNGVSDEEYIEYIRKEYGILGAKFGNRTAKDILLGAFNNGLSPRSPNQITEFKTTNEVVQERFTEIDATVEYRHDFGAFELAIGNIFFYIDRESKSTATVREFFASNEARDFIDAQSRLINITTQGPKVTFAPVLPIRSGHPEDFLRR